MNHRDRIAATVEVSDTCSDFDRVVVYRHGPSSLEAIPFVDDGRDVYDESDHDLREYPSVQALVSRRVEANHPITWHTPTLNIEF